MSSRTTTVRPTRTTTAAQSDNATSSQQDSVPTSTQDRCAHCKKFLPAVKAECRFCNKVFCMEHRHPETHSPTGCAQKAREQTRQQFQRDSGHILGQEAHDRGSTHSPGWNMNRSREELNQRLNQRLQTLKESSGRSSSSSTPGTGTGSGSGSGSTPKKGKAKGAGKKTANKPKAWGTGGQRLGGTPGSGSGSGSGDLGGSPAAASGSGS
ncbi:hypothetical protein BGZ99_001051 [Dissophora globulifera]|uniref:AN1-type domain-containing protein n=1 Tax=Dissophora globulifera TaxID=979702 RepID=A0A9P6R1L0_9FUNG|nr:hypothetical protein BGZ99_001051 [Dissophora globulifera]